ncbi:hypothetical protein C1J03_04175 [Sulfitobacter sp. SK012]|uniref:protein-disulfide reductase DsbD domain-containing protein n=1 Tax=Sulfitobacter sp. SK012 TaxID=1389005 RepID=UPI000E0C9604|nr:protein-disulfide reductase DsbD domain-containing protein [Sulfitobacter sp. SK012]AXI45304.1 hypothetical protein C1J03_04175 [Sulfitobacter sp. SK012]
MLKMLISLALMVAPPALAQSDGSKGAPISADVIQGWRQADGTQITALRLTLAPGWKTYWRAPGDAGIPPEFDWSGSRNLAGVGITWPTPEVFNQNGMRSIGYHDQLILPLHVKPKVDGKPVDIKLSMDIGVCSDICIPETLKITAILDATDAKPIPAIAAALAQRPYSGSEAGARGVTCSLRPKDGGLEITADISLPSTGSDEVVVIEAGRPGFWVSEADTSRQGNTLRAVADMVPSTGSASLDRSAIRFTVLGQNRAVDIIGCSAG